MEIYIHISENIFGHLFANIYTYIWKHIWTLICKYIYINLEIYLDTHLEIYIDINLENIQTISKTQGHSMWHRDTPCDKIPAAKGPYYDTNRLFRTSYSHNPTKYSHIVGLSSHFYAHILAGSKFFYTHTSKLVCVKTLEP